MLTGLTLLLFLISPVVLWEISYFLKQISIFQSSFFFYLISVTLAVIYGYSKKTLWINPPHRKTIKIWVGLSIFLGVLICVPWMTSLFNSNQSPSPSPSPQPSIISLSMVIFVIPIIEEYIFRKQLSGYLRTLVKPTWLGSYISILIFSFAHTHPRLTDLYSMNIGLALGPLFLGIGCEFLTYYSKSILPAIVFHAICNASGFIFSMLDSRWLIWLKDLYSHG